MTAEMPVTRENAPRQAAGRVFLLSPGQLRRLRGPVMLSPRARLI